MKKAAGTAFLSSAISMLHSSFNRPSEQFEPLGSMIRSLEFQAGGFCVVFVELRGIGAISQQFPHVPGCCVKQRLLADHLSCHHDEWQKFTRLGPFLS